MARIGLFMVAIVADILLSVAILIVYAFDFTWIILSEDSDDRLKSIILLFLYFFILSGSITRIVFGFLLTKSYERNKILGYNIPSGLNIILGIALSLAYNDIACYHGCDTVLDYYRVYPAELYTGIVVIVSNIVLLLIGLRVAQVVRADRII